MLGMLGMLGMLYAGTDKDDRGCWVARDDVDCRDAEDAGDARNNVSWGY